LKPALEGATEIVVTTDTSTTSFSKLVVLGIPTIRDLVIRNPAANKVRIRVVFGLRPADILRAISPLFKSQSATLLIQQGQLVSTTQWDHADADTADKSWPGGE
jgi:hypothetical protein